MNTDHEFKMRELNNMEPQNSPVSASSHVSSAPPTNFHGMETVSASYDPNRPMHLVGHSLGPTSSYMLDGFMNPTMHDNRGLVQYQSYGSTIGDVMTLPGTYTTGIVESPIDNVTGLFRTNKMEQDLAINSSMDTMYPPLYGAPQSVFIPTSYNVYDNTRSLENQRKLCPASDHTLSSAMLSAAPSMVRFPPTMYQQTSSVSPFSQESRANQFMVSMPPTILQVNTNNPEYASKKRKSRKNKKKTDDEPEVSEVEKEINEFLMSAECPIILRKLQKINTHIEQTPLKSPYAVPSIDMDKSDGVDSPQNSFVKTLDCSTVLAEAVSHGDSMGFGLVARVNIPEVMIILEEEAILTVDKNICDDELQEVINKFSSDTRQELLLILSTVVGLSLSSPGLTLDNLKSLLNYAGFGLRETEGDIKPAKHALSLFRTLAWVNHSCEPNASLKYEIDEITSKVTGKLTALRYIKKGESIVVNYLDTLYPRNPFASREERRELLKYHNLLIVDCKCVICDLPAGALERNQMVRLKLQHLYEVWVDDCIMRNYEECSVLSKMIYKTCLKYENEYLEWLGPMALNVYIICHLSAFNGVDTATAEEANRYYNKARLNTEKKIFDNTMKYLHHYYPLRRILKIEK